MPQFSIITCISNPDIYDKCLLKSINKSRKKHDVEIIPIINYNNRYSASLALNIGLEVSKSPIAIIVHQDVTLLDDWFDILDSYLKRLDEWAIVGAAGISLDYGRDDVGDWGGARYRDTVAIGTVWDSDENLDKPPYWNGTKELSKTHCVDECLFVVNNTIGLRFDPAFTGFHFYGIDMCLQARAAAYDIYAAHLPIIHYGKYSASMMRDQNYWHFLRFLFHKWKYRFPELLTTHMHWNMQQRDVMGLSVNYPELTSYIPINLASDDFSIDVVAMGISNVKFSNDRGRGIN